MGVVKESKRKHWVIALDSDLALIPNPVVGDTALTEDKKKQYYYDGSGWKTGLGYEFVERLTSAADKTAANFTTDGTWYVNGLDLSAIVPAGAKAVLLRVTVVDDVTGSTLVLRRDAGSDYNRAMVGTHAVNIPNNTTEIISIDTDRLLDYNASNVVFSAIEVTVVGWFI